MRPSAPPSPHSARGPRWQPPDALERAGLEKGGASVAQDPPGTQGPQRGWGCEQWAARAPWAGPHSEEQCGLTPACWPRAAAQGASAGTVTGCHARGKDWPPGHGRRGCPGRQLGWPAGARRTPRGSPRTWRCCPTLTPSTDRGGGPPVITFPMMLPTSCRKNHRKPTSSGALCPCDAGRRGPEAGRRVVRPGRLCGGLASGGSLCAHLSAADPGPPLTDGQPCRGAGQLLPANGQVAACAQRRGEPCAKPAVSGIPLHFTV